MKDLSLSALSRGCGRFVSSSQNAGTHDGRLDVCFTPQDYYIWKSQDTVLQLSCRGHVLAEKESSLPKTYSTRRGPLLLYSQYLVSLETSSESQPTAKKKKVMQRYTRQTNQMRPVRELRSAFLSNRNHQLTSSRLDQPYFIDDDHHHHLHRNPAPIYSKQEENSRLFSLQSNLHPEKRATRLLQNPLGEEEVNSTTERVRVDLFLQIPRTPTPSLEDECQTGYAALSPAEETQIYLDASLQQTEINCRRTVEESHCPNTESVDDLADEDGCIQGRKTKKDNSKQIWNVHLNRRTGLLPPLPMGYNREKALKGLQHKSEDSHEELQLPPITEEQNVPPNWTQRPKYSQTRTEELQIQQNLLPSLQLLGNDNGRKGLSKRSSLAFLHHRSDGDDPSESYHTNRGVVRGMLPLELRGLQDGKSVGSLIMGPDGEIIQLSLFVNSQDGSSSDTQEQALQVLSAEGEKLPWVVVLQSESTETVSQDDRVQLNLDQRVREAFEHQQKLELLDLHKGAEMFSPSSDTDAVFTGRKEFDTEAGAETRRKHMKITRKTSTMCPLWEQIEREEQSGGQDGNLEVVGEEKEDEKLDSHSSESHQPREMFEFKDNPQKITTERTVKAKRKKWKDVEEGLTTQTRKSKKLERRTDSDGQKIHIKKKGQSQKELWGSDVQSMSQRPEEKRTSEAAKPLEKPTPVNETTESKAERLHHETDEEQRVKAEGRRQKEESVIKRKKRNKKVKHKGLSFDSQIKEEAVENNQKMEAKSTLENQIQEDKVENNLVTEVQFHPESPEPVSPAQRCENDPDPEENMETWEPRSIRADGSIPSVSSVRSGTAGSSAGSRRRSSSTASSPEEVMLASSAGLASSHGRLSSCSTVIVMEEQLMLNPTKSESSVLRRNREHKEALLLAQRAEQRKQEVERRRREQEEEQKKQWEKEQTEDRLKNELKEDRQRRAEELRLKRLAEEEEKRKHEEEEKEQARLVQAQRERERRKQEERKRYLEHLQRMREIEDQKRKNELERVRLEEEKRQEDERKMLQEMDERERIDYLQGKEQEEEQRRKKEEDDKRAQEEAALLAAEEARLQAEMLARQTALLKEQLAFRRGLLMDAGGLEQTQGISRPWIYSYFTLIQMMGLNSRKSEATTL